MATDSAPGTAIHDDRRPVRRPRVLLLAYACSPVRGSEESVGWNRALQTARWCDTWVLCLERWFGPEVRDYFAQHGEVDGLNFEFVDMTPWERRLLDQPLLWYRAYRLWHRRALDRAQQLHRQIGFDLVHQLNYNGFREPGYLWQLDAPFVWGPVGGTQNYPWRFLPSAGWKAACNETLRNVINLAQFRLLPRVRRARRAARALITANSHAQHAFQTVHGQASVVMSDTGVARLPDWQPRLRQADQPFRLLWSGKMIPRKALHLLLEAVARVPEQVPLQVRVMGDGPSAARWKQLAERLGIQARVQWLGWVEHREAVEQNRWADAFAFTSLRDTTGAVLHEAMAAGLPVLCLDHQGAADIVTDGSGIKIPVTHPQQVVAELAGAIATLAGDSQRLLAMQQAARHRAADHLWSAQGERMMNVYREVLHQYPPADGCRIEMRPSQ